ncbi:helix-turn-helix domain-containing protein [Streptomyces triticirhizae]|uniref:Helix-turn-helix domain-containing protein n=2 Tax=Streptomyces triticirhizae TaxID=2483353 RepID=A0A3M2KRT8_9ACTN|nr:helix-turn-helix domain-containing protein [Streptomyces triticirhizae]
MTVSALIPTDLSTDHPEDFRSSITMVDLGPAQISAMAYPSISRVRRTPRLIRRSDPEYLQLSLTLDGTMALTQADNETVCPAGTLLLYDSSRPFHGAALPKEGGGVRQIVAQLPRRLVPVPDHQLAAVVADRLPGDGGMGELLAHFLVQVTNRADTYGPRDGARLLPVLIDLLSGTIGQRLDDRQSGDPAEERPTAAFLSAQRYILCHLDEPDLSPARIAAAHHVSVRSLHRLFQRNGTTVRSFLREQRLERARRTLMDLASARLSIAAIARRHGFTHPGDFTRAFRAAYGQPPRDYREAALRGAAGCGGA